MRDLLSRRWTTSALAGLCLILAAVGFWLGRTGASFSPAASPTKTSSQSLSLSSSVSTAPAAENRQDDGKTGASWDSRWKSLSSQPNTPMRNRELAALIEELAKTDPQRALSLARSVDDWRLRDILRNAAARGWAMVKPDAAADWALTVRPDDRRSVVEALMQGAAIKPAEAVRVALNLCKADPAIAGDYGHYTIAALVENGAFQDAVKFGTAVGTEKYPFLLKSVFYQWGRNQPEQAVAAADAITDPVMRSKVMAEAVAGWAWADAKSVAEYAMALPAGGARSHALAEALPRWVEKDPMVASEWINSHDAGGAEFDAGIVAMANMQSLITKQPDTAMGLAGNISNPAEREHTMRAVFRQWAGNDLAAAKRYIDSTNNPKDRNILVSELKDLFPD